MRILGLDPGLRRTGWGVIEKNNALLTYVACGVILSDDKGELPFRLTQIYNGIKQVIETYKPDTAGVEITFVNKDAGATLKLGQARGVALLVPALYHLTIGEYEPNRIKKSIVGSGHADKTQIQAMVKLLLPKADFKSADAADALAIAITHAHYALSLKGITT
jgi:crossover junction endodeoxyribonuclease RuvC